MYRNIIDIKEHDLREMYEIYGMTQQAIAEHYGCSRASIGRRMQRYDIQARYKYSINSNFFKAWTSESAWLYDWSIGDGTFTNPCFLRFNLSSKDKEVLFKFKKVLDSEHPVKDYEVLNKLHQKYHKFSRVIFRSQELVFDLKQLSYLDEDLTSHFDHFIRGFFEAEGSVYLAKVGKYRYINSNISNNDKELLQYIWDFLIGADIVVGGSLYQNYDGWRLIFAQNDSILLYHFMYDDCSDMFLKRKKEKFEELIEVRNVIL